MKQTETLLAGINIAHSLEGRDGRENDEEPAQPKIPQSLRTSN